MSAKEKWVRRFSVDETARHKNGFTIYKITSVLFPIHSPEVITMVSVWKRYSDVQALHKSMKLLHAGLHLRGTFPQLGQSNYFKRFQQEVIDERAKSIKALLEFVAEHKLLFTSTDFVNFLQTGYPAPEARGGVASARSSLHLPVEGAPLECHTDDDDASTPQDGAQQNHDRDETDYSISEIPIYEGSLIETRQSPKNSETNSIESIPSLDSDLYDELNKITIDKKRPSIKVLPDLINFDVPSTSFDSRRSSLEYEDSFSSRMSISSRSVLSLSNVECRTRTEDSYVFEAGYLLNLAVRCEEMGDYGKAFDCYKSGIEKMLIGVQADTDQQRRALIKEKTNKYLAYAEQLYRNHLVDNVISPLSPQTSRPLSLPISMLSRQYSELSLYSVLGILASSVMLVLNTQDQSCCAMKVIQKIPNNLTEFDEYILQNTEETKRPILPTNVPYMIPLNSYIETNNLIFLILAYAPGEKLFNYIKNYAKSNTNTPLREVNLENVFTEPKTKDSDNNKFNTINESGVKINESGVRINESGVRINESVAINESNVDFNDKIECNLENNNVEMSVDELVLNSQRLLQNVDKVLSEPNISAKEVKEEKEDDHLRLAETPIYMSSPCPRNVLPPSAICKWAAEILTALESLHNCGVICRDLNPSNILLGDRGQILLTYMYSYADSSPHMRTHAHTHVAPETRDALAHAGKECDFWSFGVVLYELLCGVPLSYYHRSPFTSHTILQLPEGLSVEVQSLLTQLLTFEPSERLGGGPRGIEEIKRHPYFKAIDWQAVYDSWVVPD